MECDICKENHSETRRLCAILCGHIFCRPCITLYCKSQRSKSQQIVCPTCRVPFDEVRGVIGLYITVEDDAGPSSASRSNQAGSSSSIQATQARQLAAQAAQLGLESAHTDLQSTVFRAETFMLDASIKASDKETKEALDRLGSTLESLRSKLVYTARLDSLKAQNAELIAENSALQASFFDLEEKFSRTRKIRERQARTIITLEERTKHWETAAETAKTAHEASIKLIVAANTARDAARAELEEAKMAAANHKADQLKLRKKYAVLKHERRDVTQLASGSRQDDSLEIIPPPSPPQRQQQQQVQFQPASTLLFHPAPQQPMMQHPVIAAGYGMGTANHPPDPATGPSSFNFSFQPRIPAQDTNWW